MIDTRDSVVMLPVGVGSGAVVSSKGRVVGGISVMLPVGSESVMFVVAVTTRVDADTSVKGVILFLEIVEFITGISTVVVPVLTGRVRVNVVLTATELEREKLPNRLSLVVESDSLGIELELVEGVGVGVGADVTGTLELTGGSSTVDVKPVDNGTVSTKVVFTGGVTIAMLEFEEGVITPLADVEFDVRVLLERLIEPKRLSVPVDKDSKEVELTDAGGMTPEIKVELTKAVVNAVEKLPEPSFVILPVGVGTGRVEFTVSVTTNVLSGGMIPSAKELLAVAVANVIVMFPEPAMDSTTSVMRGGGMMPRLPVEFRVAVEVDTAVEPLPVIVVFEITTTTVSEETAVTTVGVSTPTELVEVMVRTELEATTSVLVFGCGGP